MSKDLSTLHDDSTRVATLPRDWFLPAIESDKGVGGYLEAVIDELQSRAQFIHALKQNLDQKLPSGLDSITNLSQKIRGLENTLRFRLGILRPERPQAWFRASAVTTAGPFSSTIINEPVFAPYEPFDVDKLQAELRKCWDASTNKVYTFQDSSSCLWRTLLAMKWEHELICRLKAPFDDMRLDVLPDHLPARFESRALRAFLLNVRNEVQGLRLRLDHCYNQLIECSMRFWEYQKKHIFNAEQARSWRPQSNQTADSVREELRKRRANQAQFLTPGDINALRFMGFQDLPNHSQLRQRYIELAKKMHPDRFGGEDQSFKQLSQSYSHLLERIGAA